MEMDKKDINLLLVIHQDHLNQAGIVKGLEVFDLTVVNRKTVAQRTMRRQHFDCVLTYHREGSINGLEILEIFRKEHETIPFLLVAEELPMPVMADILELGLSRLIIPPVEMESLISMIVAKTEEFSKTHARNEVGSYGMSNVFNVSILPHEQAILALLETINDMIVMLYPKEYERIPELKTVLYEALSNAAEHGSPNKEESRIFVEVVFRMDSFRFVVRDCGAGFDYNSVLQKQVQEKGNYGLSMIREMVDEMNFNTRGNVISCFKILKPLVKIDPI